LSFFHIHKGNEVRTDTIIQLTITENNLRESRDLFRTFMDHSNDAIFIHDLEGKILNLNETMLRMYQLTREEALTVTK